MISTSCGEVTTPRRISYSTLVLTLRRQASTTCSVAEPPTCCLSSCFALLLIGKLRQPARWRSHRPVVSALVLTLRRQASTTCSVAEPPTCCLNSCFDSSSASFDNLLGGGATDLLSQLLFCLLLTTCCA